MALDMITYALAKKYTDNSMQGGGAVAGKNCVITSITPITGGNRVTFQWTLDNGTVQTDTMDVMDGAKGDTGAQGPKGDTGATGAQGIQGIKGDTGAQGPKGDKGDTGATGAKGDQGIQGIKGDKGDDGYPFLIYKQYDDISEFDEDDFPEIGLMFMVMDFIPDTGYPIYRYTGTGTPPYSLVTYMNTEGIKGDKGDKGDQGEQGIQGPKGDKGDKGDQGDQGIQGIQGEQGEQGPTGATGAKGDKGDKGDTGEGVPEGGTAGQVLKKKSNTDYDTEWGEAASPLTFDSDDFDVSAQNAVSLDPKQRYFVGTTAEWTALSSADKAKYTLVNLTDDAESLGSEIVDAVTDGVMNPVTSNATRDAIYNLEEALKWSYITGTPISPVTSDIRLYYNAISCSIYFSIPAGEYTCNQLYGTDYYYVRLASYTMADVKTAFPGAENVAIGNGIGLGRYFSNQRTTIYTCYLVRYNTSTWFFVCNGFRSQTSGAKITINAAESLYNPHSLRTSYYGFPEI